MDNERPEAAVETTDTIFPGRKVPQWVRITIWVVGAACFPMGIFICLALAKALRWWAAILLAVLSLGVFYALSMIGEETGASLGNAWYWLAVGQFQYNIGKRHGLWSPSARRVWKTFGWLGLGLTLLLTLTGYVYYQIPSEYR